MVAQEFSVDLSKPLVFQVGHLGEAYQEWVHQPIVCKEGPRLFENHIMELLTRTKWWVIPVVWLPVVSWYLLKAIRMGISIHEAAPLVMVGVLAWSLLEYSLHRFLFHMNTKSYWTNTVHYMLHGCHHKHPMDGLRLVFPPAATAILCVPFWGLIRLMSTPAATPAIFSGSLLGYVIYDCTHYYLHHGSPSNLPVKNLKNSDQRVWDHIFIVGCCAGNIATTTENSEEWLILFT
ncbi:dihydroceramide fatty acyl 2-hydroxylase FAH1-like isoform X2 [Phalaenopsis equestris]|uniref:dihydroceramide fatty acyl 2-hydroxylase FAH1-like isoform X2 n=1 Tax=Phalaenopsis equestris TaxID=78828 RepID=UPI0009E314B2|nr:dihydroceramide fatty acyl 2-hydroxylase FAH1-like isoform X2 [Phalaenopsis equestris]